MSCSESVQEHKKQMLILNNIIIYIVFLLSCFHATAQSDLVQKWEQERQGYVYEKSGKYKGPQNWHSSSPKRISSGTESNYGKGSGKRGKESSTSGGLRQDPRVQRPGKTERRASRAPKLKSPNVNVNLNSSLWKYLLILIIGIAVVFILYLIIKNRKPADEKIVVEIEDAWNPEIITKSELQLRLEEALSKENYRECVRIYFTFILKELVRKSWIFWKKEKTNFDYILEMRSRANSVEFEECVRIYDLIWYGEYNINRDEYQLLLPLLANYHKKLEHQ